MLELFELRSQKRPVNRTGSVLYKLLICGQRLLILCRQAQSLSLCFPPSTQHGLFPLLQLSSKTKAALQNKYFDCLPYSSYPVIPRLLCRINIISNLFF